MRWHGLIVCALALFSATTAGAESASAATAAAPAPVIVSLRIDGAIGPATASYVERGLQHAAQRGAVLAVLQLDTPGGLDASMRSIIQAILASEVPVATFVAPSGARAASAGTYILCASAIAAMAPATTLGAATPVAIGLGAPGGRESRAASGESAGAGGASGAASASGAPAQAEVADPMQAKRVSDAAAYIRSLAQLRGRNAEWYERAVRDAASLASAEALARKVVDIVAVDLPDLLRQLDGRVQTLPARPGASVAITTKLATAGATVEPYEPAWRDRLLAAIGDPTLALLLLTVGFYGLLFEFANPGLVLPGVIGGLCLLLGLFGLQTLPVNAAGVALVLLGLTFFAIETFVPSYGSLGLGGVAAFTLGALMLIDTDAPGFGVPHALIYALAAASLGVVLGLATLAARTRRRAPASGAGLLVGAIGEVVESAGPHGWAQIHGEHWRVRSTHALQPGERIRVTRIDGLTLEVEGAS